METRELRGGALAAAMREEVRAAAERLSARGVHPRLVAVFVGSDPSVLNYLEVKSRAAEKTGILVENIALPPESTQAELQAKLASLAAEAGVHGILLELPLPVRFDVDAAIAAIPPHKDVDGLTPENLGLAMAGREDGALLSATAQACIALAEGEGPLPGKRVAVVGKGRTVGRPLIPMLLNRGATVTICHSKTVDLRESLEHCEIVFSGVGKPGVINARVIQAGQIIIDAGTTVVNGRLLGDASLDVWSKAAAVTPVPEGVGPLTTAFAFKNLLKAIKLQGL